MITKVNKREKELKLRKDFDEFWFPLILSKTTFHKVHEALIKWILRYSKLSLSKEESILKDLWGSP